MRSWLHVWVYGNCLPEGVTLDPKASQVRLTGDHVKGTLVITAKGDAKPVERQLIPILAEVPISFSFRMYYAGDPLWLTVEGSR